MWATYITGSKVAQSSPAAISFNAKRSQARWSETIDTAALLSLSWLPVRRALAAELVHICVHWLAWLARVAQATTPRGAATAGPTPRSALTTPGAHTAQHTPRAVTPLIIASASDTGSSPHSYPLPAGKAASMELQAKVLMILSSLLSHPGVADAVLHSPSSRTRLCRLLLHFFAPAPGSSGSPAAQATGDEGDAAAAAAPAKPGVAKGTATAKGPSAATASRKPCTPETTAAAGQATPRKSTVGAALITNKDIAKVRP